MKYLGSKSRIAKYILPIILADRKDGQWYVEPFCGGCNTLDKVTGNRIGADINEYLISAMETIRDSAALLPKDNTEFTEDAYKSLKENVDYKFYGFAGFSYSFSGKWMAGWCRDSLCKRDYVSEAYKNAIKQHPLLKDVIFYNKPYTFFTSLTKPCIIYCDPPYQGTTGYKTGTFNHDEFWQWCRDMTNFGHKVFISEYNAPDDFTCVWEMELSNTVSRGAGAKAIEKLFIYNKR